MEKIKVIIDKEAKTLHVWFDDPANEYVCEETGDEIILIKNKTGKVIGFEKLNFAISVEEAHSAVEAVKGAGR